MRVAAGLLLFSLLLAAACSELSTPSRPATPTISDAGFSYDGDLNTTLFFTPDHHFKLLHANADSLPLARFPKAPIIAQGTWKPLAADIPLIKLSTGIYVHPVEHDAGLTAFIATPRNVKSPTDTDPLLYLSIPGEGSFFLPQFTVSPGAAPPFFLARAFWGGPLYPLSNPPLQMPELAEKYGPPLYKALLELSLNPSGPKPWPTWTIATAADAIIVARYDRPAAATSEYNEITESPPHPDQLVFSDVLVIRTGEPAKHHGNFHFHGRPAALAQWSRPGPHTPLQTAQFLTMKTALEKLLGR